jgi:hypothetical protein
MAALKRNRQRQWVAVLALVLVLLTVGLGVKLVPVSPAPVERSHPEFQISTLDLTGEHRVAVLTGEGMAPGDTVSGALTLANPARAALSYRMVNGIVATTDELAAALILDIRAVGTSCDDFDGVGLYHGPLATASIGRPPADARPLAGASAEILCFRAELPIETGNAAQGAAATASFRFDVEWAAETP